MRWGAARPWFAGRRVLVVGLGKSGEAALGLLHRLGANLSLSDRSPLSAAHRRRLPRGVRVVSNQTRALRQDWELIIVSPGVPSALWRPAQERGIPVWGELELGCRVLRLLGRWPRRVAGITGTNGKTTTTSLVGALCRAQGWPTVVAGNIGTPLCGVLSQVKAETALVLEVSSYQLESVAIFSPTVGVVLNVTPDHLARHGTMAAYAQAKFRLFQGGGTAVLNARDAWCRRMAAAVPGGVWWFNQPGSMAIRGRQLVSAVKGAEGRWPFPRHLMGRHNLDDAMAAILVARHLGVSSQAVTRGLQSFHPVAHRLEVVAENGGVRYINDSKATNVDSTLVALKALPGPLHLILGGEDKGSPYTPLKPWVLRRVKQVLLIGEATPLIQRDLAGTVPLVDCGTLEQALFRAAQDAQPGDTVLLSPACASFDQFKNFEHRGDSFRAVVKRILHKPVAPLRQ